MTDCRSLQSAAFRANAKQGIARATAASETKSHDPAFATFA
jgi:hypothetical protein